MRQRPVIPHPLPAHLRTPYLLVAALMAGLCLLAAPSPARAESAIVTDSRIKTFVYNENEVFNIVTHYGYQSNIEFGNNESIQTVSVGDRVGWQIVPAGRRLFVRAMEDNAHTNMTVVTNKRAYQFDLREAGTAALLPSEELVYVIRFYYPDEPGMAPPAPLVSTASMSPAPAPAAVAAPVTIPQAAGNTAADFNYGALNYNYTFAGTGEAAPVKIYDDGQSTYFKFQNPALRPAIAAVSASGTEMPLNVTRNAEGLVVVNSTASRFTVKSGNSRVVVYNENQVGR